MSNRTCFTCKHSCWESGGTYTTNWSSIACLKDHFYMTGKTSDKKLESNILKARKCEDYESTIKEK